MESMQSLESLENVYMVLDAGLLSNSISEIPIAMTRSPMQNRRISFLLFMSAVAAIPLLPPVLELPVAAEWPELDAAEWPETCAELEWPETGAELNKTPPLLEWPETCAELEKTPPLLEWPETCAELEWPETCAELEKTPPPHARSWSGRRLARSW